MRMCGAHRFISSACVVLFIIGLQLQWRARQRQAEGSFCVRARARAGMHSMLTALLLLKIVERRKRESRKWTRSFAVISNSSWSTPSTRQEVRLPF